MELQLIAESAEIAASTKPAEASNVSAPPPKITNAEEFLAYIRNPKPGKMGAFTTNEFMMEVQRFYELFPLGLYIATYTKQASNFCISKELQCKKQPPDGSSLVVKDTTLLLFFESITGLFDSSPIEQAVKMLKNINQLNGVDEVFVGNRYSLVYFSMRDFMFCVNGQVGYVFDAQMVEEQEFYIKTRDEAMCLVNDFMQKHQCFPNDKTQWNAELEKLDDRTVVQVCIADKDSEPANTEDIQDMTVVLKPGIKYSMDVLRYQDSTFGVLQLRSENASLLESGVRWIMLPISEPIVLHAEGAPNGME